MAKTVKSDWLNNFLDKEGALMSGHPTLSKQLGVSDYVSCCFRFIYDYIQGSVIYILTIETTEQQEIDFFLDKNPKQSLTPFYDVFGSDLIVLFYSTDNFCLYNKGANVKSLNSSELQNIVATLNPALTKNVGSTKAINKTINDAFQSWTRSNLTQKCVVNDIDGIYYVKEGKSLFLELKRVEEDLDTWRPYLDDLPNYRALRSISNQLGGSMLVYAYQDEKDQLLALHYNLNANSWNEIRGRYILSHPKFLSPSKIGSQYISINRRVH
jgi:hypothetical protein